MKPPAPTTGGAPRRAGRPTHAQQRDRVEELLAVALDVFLDYGFEQATIDEIAGRVSMSKRTVYAYHQDKSALFRAAVHRAVELYTVPREVVEAVVGEDLEASLKAIARLRIDNLSNPVSVKLQRILSAQAYKFPDLFEAAFEVGAGPTISVLAELFARHQRRAEIAAIDPVRAASAFLSLVIGGLARRIVAGTEVHRDDIQDHIDFGVRIFLHGVTREVARPSR